MSFSYVPAPTPTPGMPPDTIAPSSEWLNTHIGGHLIAACVAFMVICALFVGLRFWSRQLQHSPVGLDDYLIYPALIACWVSEATCAVTVPNAGVGTRSAYWVISRQEYVLVEWAKYIFVIQMCYLLAVCLAKLAIIAIFLRVLRDPVSRQVAQVLVGVTIATFVSEAVACSVQCIPFDYQWDKTIPGGHCFNQIAFYKYISVPNIITDLVLLGLPVPTIRRLNVSRSQKLQLALAFLTGSFGTISSILRLAYFFTTNPTTKASIADPTYNSVVLMTWTVIEPAMYLISACLPTLRPLLNAAAAKAGMMSLQSSGLRKSQKQSTGANSRWSQTKLRSNPGASVIQSKRIHHGHELILDDDSQDRSPLRETYIPPAAHIPREGQILQMKRIDATRSNREPQDHRNVSFNYR